MPPHMFNEDYQEEVNKKEWIMNQSIVISLLFLVTLQEQHLNSTGFGK